MIEPQETNVLEFSTRKTRDERKTFQSLVNIMKALRDGELNYVLICASTKLPDAPGTVMPTNVKMHYNQFDKLKEEELQLMIDFLHESADDLMKLYFTNPS